MLLTDWGLRPELPLDLREDEIPARVVEEQKTSFQVITERGVLAAQITGKLLRANVNRLERPVVGDWVAVRPLWNEHKAVIQRVLPRTSLLRRKSAGETEEIQPLAANVDLTVIVTSLNKEFNEKRLQRYLTVAFDSGTRTAIVLTKSDLAPESVAEAANLAAKYKVPCLALCAFAGNEFGPLRALWAPGETAVFVGSSGVGKSTLVNALLGSEKQSTGLIREEDDRGRHTTTSRRLLALPNGALVIDTPGLREIQLEGSQAEGLEQSFAAIDVLALQCRFANCVHESEPGCAVKAAVDRGAVTAQDLASFAKLRREMAAREKKARQGGKNR